MVDKQAIIREYDPRLELWFIDRIRPVVDQTPQSICIRESFFKRRVWYPIKPIGMRFEVIDGG